MKPAVNLHPVKTSAMTTVNGFSAAKVNRETHISLLSLVCTILVTAAKQKLV